MTTIGAALVGGAWLWGKFGDKVTERAGKLLGDAGRLAWKKIDWQGAAEHYRGEMQLRYGTMRIIGMAEPVALADIITADYLTASARMLECLDLATVADRDAIRNRLLLPPQP